MHYRPALVATTLCRFSLKFMLWHWHWQWHRHFKFFTHWQFTGKVKLASLALACRLSSAWQ